MRRANVMTAGFLLLTIVFGGAQTNTGQATTERRMSLDVKDTDIRDAIRMISKAYDLNIVLDNDVSAKVTMHLSDVPIMEGLRTLSETHGLEVVIEGSVYRIRRKVDSGLSSIRFIRGKLTVDVQNVGAMDFIKELSAKTSVSIVPDSKLEGKVSGKLFEVEFDDGIRAILEGNGYAVVRRRNIYQVSMKQTETQGASARRPSTRTGMSDFFVDFSNEKLTIEVNNGNLEDVLKAISEQSDVQIVTYGGVKAEVNAKLYDKSLTEAFALLLGGTQYTFVEKDGIILIGDRNAATPSGQALSKSELVPLKHIKADEVPQILPKNISANNVKVIKEQNALLVTGTSEDIVQMRDFLGTIDIPTPQVRIDAVIVEYKDNLQRDFGIRFWRDRKDLQGTKYGESYSVLPGPETQVSQASSLLEIGASAAGFKKFFGIENGILGKIPDDFYMVLRWLETENKAKILAQPSILTLNGRKASISVDETQYFKVPTVVTGVNEKIDRIQPIKFGITLDITPWISQGGQITAEISPVVSNSDGTTSDQLPNVSSRSLTTTVRLNNGETLKLGGLINHKESRSASKIPILGDLPILGVLFRSNSRVGGKTNLVVYITPHIVNAGDTVSLNNELRDYDLYLMNEVERKTFQRYRDVRTRMGSSEGDTTGTEPAVDGVAPRRSRRAKKPADSTSE